MLQDTAFECLCRSYMSLELGGYQRADGVLTWARVHPHVEETETIVQKVYILYVHILLHGWLLVLYWTVVCASLS
jgi:hypothetical protein